MPLSRTPLATLGAGLLAAAALLSCRAANTAGTGPDTTTTDSTRLPPPPPVPRGTPLIVAGNISQCGTPGDAATAFLVDSLPGDDVITLGDAAFPAGSVGDYHSCYDPTWGRFLARTWAVLGNHDYDSSSVAAGAFTYFGPRVGPVGKGYYSLNLGAWHVVVLNDNIPFASGSAQETWLRTDLAASHARCTMALWHQPLFLSSNSPGFTERSTRKILWDDLAAAGADVVVNGHQHHYERMAPMLPNGARDDTTGIRQFNVGTGGSSLESPDSAINPNSQVRAAVFGVLRLQLRDSSYHWQFLPVAGQTFSDSGTAACH